MVSSDNRELALEEEDIDEVIGYDKRSAHKGFLSNLKFARELRKKKFDIAIALHPSTRGHLLLFAAGIPRRIGYNKKWGHLLTKRIPHEKQYGNKHEVDYNLELVRLSGFDISDADRQPRVLAGEKKLKEMGMRLKELGATGAVVAIHAGASCRSKRWPLERFAAAADILSEKYSAEIVIVGDGASIKGALDMEKMMKKKPFDMTGELGVSELAALFSMCSLVISNDSGPAHLAAAVGTPVVVIFGRNDPGLSPARWAPVTDKKRVLHSPPACSPCLAHNCEIAFRCLSNITVQNVVEAANALL